MTIMIDEAIKLIIFTVMLIAFELIFLNNKKVITLLISSFLIVIHVPKICMGVSIGHSLFIIALCIFNIACVFFFKDES